jgi:hypothetical protein
MTTLGALVLAALIGGALGYWLHGRDLDAARAEGVQIGREIGYVEGLAESVPSPDAEARIRALGQTILRSEWPGLAAEYGAYSEDGGHVGRMDAAAIDESEGEA